MYFIFYLPLLTRKLFQLCNQFLMNQETHAIHLHADHFHNVKILTEYLPVLAYPLTWEVHPLAVRNVQLIQIVPALEHVLTNVVKTRVWDHVD